MSDISIHYIYNIYRTRFSLGEMLKKIKKISLVKILINQKCGAVKI